MRGAWAAATSRSGVDPEARVAALLYGLVFVAAVAQTAIVPLLPGLAAANRLSTAATAALVAAPGATTLAVSIPAGMVADRLGARRVTLAAGALMAVAVLAQAVPGYAWLLGGRLAFGVAYGVVWTTAVAWIAHAGDGAAPRRQATTVTSAAVGIAAGPAVGALVAAHGGLGAPFIASGLAAAALTAGLAVASAGRPAAARAPDTRSATGPQPSDGDVAPRVPAAAHVLARIAHRGRSARGLAAGALAIAISGATNSVLQLLVPLQLHRAGASAATIGLAFSCAAALYIAVSAVVVRLGRRAVTSRTNALAALLLALALLPAGSIGTAAAVVVTLMLAVAPRATVSTIAYPLATGDAARTGLGQGAAVGLLNGAWAVGMLAAPLGAGALAHWAGMRVAWLTTLSLGALAAAWLLARERRPATAPATR